MGDPVSFSSSAGQAHGYLARPEGPVAGGIVVIQEWWGLVPHIEDVADRFAALGYAALAPDLYHGRSTVEAEEAHHLSDGLDWTRARAEIAGAAAHLQAAEGAGRIGVVGFCMGGALTLIAASDPAVSAWVAFYGFPPAGRATIDEIAAPGLILFGEHEHAFSVPDAQAYVAARQAAGHDVELRIYPGARHGFFNDTRGDIYHPASAADAWARTVELFGRHVRA